MNEYAIRLEKEDNVIIARRELKKGLVIEEEGVTLLEDIPAGYKIATMIFEKGRNDSEIQYCHRLCLPRYSTGRDGSQSQ